MGNSSRSQRGLFFARVGKVFLLMMVFVTFSMASEVIIANSYSGLSDGTYPQIGDINDKNAWEGVSDHADADTYTIKWITANNRWEIWSDFLYAFEYYHTSTAPTPPTTGWFDYLNAPMDGLDLPGHPLMTVTVIATNTTPTISINNETNLSYTENDPVTQIDALATTSDADGDADWDGGTLKVQITANNEAADELSILDNIGGTINTSGTNILNGATVIGTLSASEGTVTNGTALTITFNSVATNALVQQVVRALHYRSTSDNPGTSNRTVTFTVTDKNAGSANDTRTVSVNANDNDAPTIYPNNGLLLDEGATASILLESLAADDVDDDNRSLTYTITASPSNGQVENTDNPGLLISTFTQQELTNGKIQYVHDDGNTTTDAFTFKVSDGTNELTGQTFSITIAAIDDDTPEWKKNYGLELNEGATELIPSNSLEYTDADSDNSTLLFTVTNLTDNGEVKKSGTALLLNGTFTQQDLIDGKIQYVHDGSNTTSDSFVFKVADGTPNELTGQTYNITVNAVDDDTETPTLAAPTTSSTDNNSLDIDFTLPEAASSGAVKMTFTRTSGSADGNAPHIVTFAAGFETAAQHTTALNGTDLSNNANVVSVSSGANDALVNGTIYSVKIEYQDYLGNSSASVTNTSITYDNSTQTPTLTAPAPSSTVKNGLAVDFTIPEPASSGTVKMTFTQTSGTADVNAPHIIIFNAGFETAAQHTTSLDGTDLSNNANVSSVSSEGNDILVDGAIYSVKIEYQDGVGNSAASATNTNLTYDNATQTPTLTAPSNSSADNNTLAIDFTLPELASSGTVKMTFTQTGGNTDGNSPHILIFAAGFETAAQHSTTLNGADLSANANVTSVYSDPNDALIDGAVYSVKIEYQDDVGNSAASVTNSSFTYDNRTLFATLTAPAPSSSDNSSLDIDFTLPEVATSGTVKMTFTRTSGTADGNAPHILTFAAGFETAAQHSTTLNGADLSNNANVSSVSTEGNDILVHNTVYGVKIEYQDHVGNSVSSVTNTNFTYDNPNIVPVISIDNGSLNYIENDAATQIDAAATTSDPDGDANWDGGTVTVQITANAEAGDEISIPDNVVGTINTDATNLRNGATVIGTLSASEGTVTNGSMLTITFNSSATNALVQEVLRAISYRSSSEDPGTSDRTVTVTVTDKNITSASDTRTITVTKVDDAPTIKTPLAKVTVLEDALNSEVVLSALFTDVDNDDALIVKTVKSNSDETLLTATIVANTLTLDYLADKNGTATIEITGTSNGKEVTASLEVEVTSDNDAPVITSTPTTTATEDTEWSYTIIATDVDGDIPTFTAPNLPTGMVLVGNKLSWTPQNGVATSGEITVTANDGNDALADQKFTVAVTGVNNAPTLTTTTPQTIKQGETLTLTVAMTNGADVDNTLTDASIFIGAGTNYTVTGQTITPTLDFVGELTVPVSVTDGSLSSAIVNMAVTVLPSVAIKAVESSRVDNSTKLLFAPNPVPPTANKSLFVTPSTLTGKWEVTIYDNLGNVIDFQSFSSDGGYTYSWDLKNRDGLKVSAGMYVAIISVENDRGVKEMFKRVIGVKQ
jgi:hypothetical protein